MSYTIYNNAFTQSKASTGVWMSPRFQRYPRSSARLRFLASPVASPARKAPSALASSVWIVG